MATPGQLVKCVSEALGLPEATVFQYDRALSESGLRTKSGRGPSAAQVGVEDAANLLLAIVGAPMMGAGVRGAPDTCEQFSALQPEYRSLFGLQFPAFSEIDEVKEKLPALAGLPKRHSLHDAIAALINAAAEGELDSVFSGSENRSSQPHKERVSVRVELSTPFVRGTITIDFGGPGLRNTRTHTLDYWPKRSKRSSANTDLVQQRYFSHKTILAIGALIGASKASQPRRESVAA